MRWGLVTPQQPSGTKVLYTPLYATIEICVRNGGAPDSFAHTTTAMCHRRCALSARPCSLRDSLTAAQYHSARAETNNSRALCHSPCHEKKKGWGGGGGQVRTVQPMRPLIDALRLPNNVQPPSSCQWVNLPSSVGLSVNRQPTNGGLRANRWQMV